MRPFYWFFVFILLGLSGVAHGDDYPERPIKLIVPYPTGGGTDIAARLNLLPAQLAGTQGQHLGNQGKAPAAPAPVKTGA